MAFQQDIAINALWYSSTPDETPATNGISDAIHGAVAVNTTNGNMWIRVIGGGLTGNWEAVGSGSGGFTSFTLAGDSGTNQTIENTNTVTIEGDGTALATVASATDTITLNHATGAGFKHIPSGGASGNVLTYSASGTAVWAAPASAAVNTGVVNRVAYYNTTTTINDTPAITVVTGTSPSAHEINIVDAVLDITSHTDSRIVIPVGSNKWAT